MESISNNQNIFTSVQSIASEQEAPELWLAELCAAFPGKVVFTSSLGIEDQVITHLLATHKIPARIVTLDTGRLFSESYELIQRTMTRCKINIELFFPDTAQVEQLVAAQGINGFYDSIENRKRCCQVRKVEPLRRALSGAAVWITGIRKEQSENRSDFPVAEWDEQHQVAKVHPLLHWSEEQVWNYIREHSVPYNPLHDKGFPSIGCAPCTRAVLPGEPARAGRWWWEQGAQECGLHQAKPR